jgi:hypothetical protein
MATRPVALNSLLHENIRTENRKAYQPGADCLNGVLLSMLDVWRVCISDARTMQSLSALQTIAILSYISAYKTQSKAIQAPK